METSPDGRRLIEAFEGLRLQAYQDATGIWTIGYGHTTASGGDPVVRPGQKITQVQADAILGADLKAVERTVRRVITRPMKQCEFDALVSFEFNTGDLPKSSIDDKINRGDPKAAMETLLQYDHAGGLILAGLQRRRMAEKLMFEGRVGPALSLAGGSVGPTPKAKRRPAPVPIPQKRPRIPKNAAVGTAIAATTVAASQSHSWAILAAIVVAGIAAALALHFLWPKKG